MRKMSKAKTMSSSRRKRHHLKTRKVTAGKVVDEYANTALYPPIKALQSYRMKVSDLHTIAYWTYGNKLGKPVLYVHGGPGAGSNPNMARFFNPQLYYIVLVDQRGCGESTPFAELKENTTQDLIADFEKIRKSLHINKWQVFGGSWGSTLSLAYAIAHPDKTTELVVRGIFLARQSEVDWVQEPNGAEHMNLEGWKHYASMVKGRLHDLQSYTDVYTNLFSGMYGAKERDKALKLWSAWEESISTLQPEKWETIMKKFKMDKSYIAMSSIEHHYFTHNCFLPKGYFFDKRNMDRIRHIPTVIVQGLYDLVCPNVTARQLHEMLPKAKFTLTIAGHSGMQPENIRYLVEATDSFANAK